MECLRHIPDGLDSFPPIDVDAMKDDNEDSVVPEKVFERQTTSVKIDKRFEISKTGQFAVQFAHLYFSRLLQLRKIVANRAIEKWGRNIPLLEHITLLKDGECVIIGTFFKKMKLKARILDEYSENFKAAEINDFDNLVSSDDVLIIEDVEGRIDVKNLPPEKWITGIVVALKGRQVRSEFVVSDICIPELPKQLPLPPKLRAFLDSSSCSSMNDDDIDQSTQNSSRFVALMSGFQIGDKRTNPLPFQMMIDYISGFLGSEQEQEFCSKIVRVIIAGNSLVEYHPDIDDMSRKQREADTPVTRPLQQLDLLMTQLSSSVPVDLMCGPSDPSNFSLPQQPFHRCLFPSSTTFDSFHRASNPHALTIDDISFLGTSGQNIDDMRKYATFTNEFEALEGTLRWRVICPTAPDTLGCHPSVKEDVFVIDECPHVYFAGNQKEFSTKLFCENGRFVRLINIPSFAETHSIVLLDLNTLECHPIQFDVPLSD
uniref:DNA polymerase delta small subunit isoform X2 n=2 Tax=Hirondellea gigas TaxID=1518452 RepID=A0A6A7G6P8_9CRUS